ncbi:MAG: extracellular solute-binding protein [Candidatus Bathyarchaeia archaeon]
MGISLEKMMAFSIGILVVALMAFATIPLPSSTASPTTKLKILSPHWEGILKEFKAAFEAYEAARGKNVEVEWVDLGGTENIIRFIDSEFAKSPEGIGWDILWGGGVDPFIIQAEKGQLQGYQVPQEILSKIPATFAGLPMYDNVHTPPRWYGTALSGFGIVYNKVVLAAQGLPVPKTWEDLARPEVKGWVGSADPRQSGSTRTMYEIILQAYGWEKGLRIATLLGANVKSFPASSSAIPKAVGTGDIAYGLAIDFYAWSEVMKHGADKIGYVMPEGLTVINPDSIGILKGAPNLEIAQDFVNFVLSKEGQKLWMLRPGDPEGPKTYLLGRMSVIPELFTELGNRTVVPINPFQIKTALVYNSTKGSLREGLIGDLIGALIIDSHEELFAAWSSILEINQTLTKAKVTSPRIQEAINKLGSAPLPEAQALSLGKQWSDPTVRNQYIANWHSFATTKYREASAIAAAASSEIISSLRTEAQNNLYIGIGGGFIIGLVIGILVVYAAMRRRELAAVKK